MDICQADFAMIKCPLSWALPTAPSVSDVEATPSTAGDEIVEKEFPFFCPCLLKVPEYLSSYGQEEKYIFWSNIWRKIVPSSILIVYSFPQVGREVFIKHLLPKDSVGRASLLLRLLVCLGLGCDHSWISLLKQSDHKESKDCRWMEDLRTHLAGDFPLRDERIQRLTGSFQSLTCPHSWPHPPLWQCCLYPSGGMWGRKAKNAAWSSITISYTYP